ncbi:alkaline phosphatase D family protein [Arenibacter sp. F20364]|jgi:alkaline phosphatase D|uniref:alkaline phosphatase D family protein n=1 Tax=Arenibacter sp. F20364 TaxID=2926415 RepID=UPI001FF3309B|nr:alkaline phosphatase D family protein [Arenibacter sp. F20364]MCK0190678.1 alkaline phosphatase D family protein [Arenibacter sp. F20364]
MKKINLKYASLIVLVIIVACESKKKDFFTSGFRTMEVSDSTALIWTRLYGQAAPNLVVHQKTDEHPSYPIDFDEEMALDSMDGGVPGVEGAVRLILTDGLESMESPWVKVTKENDFTASHLFSALKPDTQYEVTIESKASGNKVSGNFRTAPTKTVEKPIHFTTSTCQYFWSYDDSLRGFKVYDAMNSMNPDFFVQTGDYVYYDRKGPVAKDIPTARHKWHAMDSWSSLVDFHLKVPMYMIKDDHDLLRDDISDKNRTYGKLSWNDGLKIWKENVPLRGEPYRTFRWGKDLQIWLVEGREFRSENKMEDGPDKTILGSEQKSWLEQTLKESDATFKILFSATPIIGPDRENKKDNHANKGFQTEGDWMRGMLSQIDNVYIINGDRHWQYHSVDSVTQVNEFGSGPVSDSHSQGWDQEDMRPQHRFLRVNGGFLGVKITRESSQPEIKFIHYDVDGNEVYSAKFQAEM